MSDELPHEVGALHSASGEAERPPLRPTAWTSPHAIRMDGHLADENDLLRQLRRDARSPAQGGAGQALPAAGALARAALPGRLRAARGPDPGREPRPRQGPRRLRPRARPLVHRLRGADHPRRAPPPLSRPSLGAAAARAASRSGRWPSRRRRRSSPRSSGQHPDGRPDRRATGAHARRRCPRPCRPRRPAGRCPSTCPAAARTRSRCRWSRRWVPPRRGYDRVEAQIAAEGAPLDRARAHRASAPVRGGPEPVRDRQRLGVSQMQVSRIMRKALRKLLDAVQAEGDGETGAS